MSASPGILSVSGPPHKKLRKGTHSCIECRRRKKSCVPQPANPGTCEECFARGILCRNQEFSQSTKRRPQDSNPNLQQRVAELETALLSISQKLEATPRPIESDDRTAQAQQQLHSGILPSTLIASPRSNREALLEHAPVLSLFDNAILSRRPDDSTGRSLHAIRPPRSEAINNPNPRLDKICRTLLSLFPSQQRQEAILNASHNFWTSWQDVYPQMFGPGSSSNIVQFVADLKGSGSAQKIAKALLCLCIILQEESVSLSTSCDIANTADQICQTLSTIDDMVLTDDELAGTIDGVECMILRAKYEGDRGRIRRQWLMFRRGISFAQLLGLHKHLGNSESNTSDSIRRGSLWKALYSGDRFLSLTLGLPYGPSEIHSDIGRDRELCATGIQVQDTGEHYLFRLSNIVGHIIDRNQQLPSNNMLPLTFKIEAEMIELTASMPNKWWQSGREPCVVASQLYSQLLPQFWHHQARTLLHLPYMLKATTSRRFEYNKIATLESAREMIARYRVIRPVQGFSSLVCKLIDFQVFTAAMILVLNLLDHYRVSGILNHSEAENDQDLISVTTVILQRASAETDVCVATQAARALEIFSNIKALVPPIGKSAEECTTKVVIPYFGAVVIGPGTSLRDQAQAQNPKAMPQPHQMPTPSDQSPNSSIPESMPPSNPSIAPMIPFEFSYGDNAQGIGRNIDVFPDIDFDLDQDWGWYWDNTDIPLVESQGTVG